MWTVSNSVGAGITPPLAIGPGSVTLGASCSSVASAIIVGGTGSYFAVAESSYLSVNIAGNTVTVRRTAGTPPPTPPTPGSPLSVAITDGRDIVGLLVQFPATCTLP